MVDACIVGESPLAHRHDAIALSDAHNLRANFCHFAREFEPGNGRCQRGAGAAEMADIH